MREIRTLRAMWRALETELRQLLNGHKEGNLGYKPRRNLRATAPALDPTTPSRTPLFAFLPTVSPLFSSLASRDHFSGPTLRPLKMNGPFNFFVFNCQIDLFWKFMPVVKQRLRVLFCRQTEAGRCQGDPRINGGKSGATLSTPNPFRDGCARRSRYFSDNR